MPGKRIILGFGQVLKHDINKKGNSLGSYERAHGNDEKSGGELGSRTGTREGNA